MLPTEQEMDDSSDEVSIAEPIKPAHDSARKRYNLYLRFPKRFVEDRDKAVSDIKNLHNTIRKVRIPRQRHANFCLVEFNSQEDCDEAAKKLKNITISGRRLVVQDAITSNSKAIELKAQIIKSKRDSKKVLQKLVGNIRRTQQIDPNRSVTNFVCIKHLPRTIQENDLKEAYPELMELRLIVPKIPNKHAIAFMSLPTPRDALNATKKTFSYDGKSFAVEFQKDVPLLRMPSPQKSIHKVNTAKGSMARYFNKSDTANVKGEESDSSENEEIMNVYN